MRSLELTTPYETGALTPTSQMKTPRHREGRMLAVVSEPEWDPEAVGLTTLLYYTLK